MAHSVRVAVVQAAAALFDRQACLDKVARFTAEAAQQGAKLVLFPEAFIPGYPRGLHFGAVVGSRSAEGRRDFRHYYESAIEIPGADLRVLADIAKAQQVLLVVGVIERDGSTLYCSVVFFAADGSYLGKHRKLMPTGSERLVWGFGDGASLPVFETELGRVGAVICWENYMPLLRTAMYQKGIQIYCAPTADMRDSWLASMQHIACEGRCFVLSANQFVRGRDYPAELRPEGFAEDDIVSRGGSCIIDPYGTVLAGPHYEAETILTADIDLSSISEAKYDFDVVGHYARPDIFKLEVNESPQQSVVFRRSRDET